MKEESESTLDLEQLLRSKSWSQLSSREQAEVSQVVNGKQEYERLHAMIHQLRAEAGVHDADLVPSKHVRENLLNAFDAEQKKRRAGWWTNVSYFLNESIRFDLPLVRVGLAAVLIIGGVFTVYRVMDSESTPPAVVKNEPSAPAPAPEQAVPGNNMAPVQPEQNVTPVAPENNMVQDVTPAPPANVPAPLPVNRLPVDTSTNRMAFNPVPDSTIVNGTNMLLSPTNGTATFCCGATNGGITVTNATALGSNYNWNLSVTNGLPPRTRSLANDAQVLEVFFAVR